MKTLMIILIGLCIGSFFAGLLGFVWTLNWIFIQIAITAMILFIVLLVIIAIND